MNTIRVQNKYEWDQWVKERNKTTPEFEPSLPNLPCLIVWVEYTINDFPAVSYEPFDIVELSYHIGKLSGFQCL